MMESLKITETATLKIGSHKTAKPAGPAEIPAPSRQSLAFAALAAARFVVPHSTLLLLGLCVRQTVSLNYHKTVLK